MTDSLYITFDKDERNIDETGICIGRHNKDGTYRILKMELGEQAEILYKALTHQMTKIYIKGESEC